MKNNLILGLFLASSAVVFASTPAQKKARHEATASCKKEGKSTAKELSDCVKEKLSAPPLKK